MAVSIDFRTQRLADLFLNGGNSANAGHLTYWRETGTASLTADLKSEIESLDTRIASFQNIITEGVPAGSDDKPYDAAYLKREFMEELFGIMMRRPEYRGTASVSNMNYSDLSLATLRGHLNSTVGNGARVVWDAYSTMIDEIFMEGNKLKNSPIDPVTGAAIVSKVVTAIEERTIGGVTYDRISYDGARYYLVSQGAQVYTGGKSAIGSIRANGATGVSSTGASIDTVVSLNPASMTHATYLEVTKDLVPVSGVAITEAQRNLSPSWYIYYWNEARVKILRAQLAYKEAVTTEIRDDLAKANKAFADLEKQAGLTRSQSADGKTMNPDTSSETDVMTIFFNTNSKAGSTNYLSDRNGSDRAHNYSEWQTNRSKLKTYIDEKSTQSQSAMLDYQTTLNRYNNAFEVMSKLQEKMDGLIKNQLRNVS